MGKLLLNHVNCGSGVPLLSVHVSWKVLPMTGVDGDAVSCSRGPAI